MCYNYNITKSSKAIEKRFVAEFHHDQLNMFLDGQPNNGFTHPKLPIISNSDNSKIVMSEWGLLPTWAKSKEFNHNTLNAKIETISEKPSFKDYTSNRCLVIADSFTEWQWLDSKGKNKRKYRIHLPDEELFAFAGLWNIWKDSDSGEMIHTYTILTTEANELMSKIHNSKKRMPVIIRPEFESSWLNSGKFDMWNEDLIAEPVDQQRILTLFDD